jgi:hypothetical protein
MTDPWGPRLIKVGKIDMPTALDARALQLHGMLIPFRSTHYRGMDIEFHPSHRTRTNEAGFDFHFSTDDWFRACYQTAEDRTPGCYTMEDSAITAMCNDIVLAPLLYERKKGYASIARCLILYAQPGLAKGMYRRVSTGYASLFQGNEARSKEYIEDLDQDRGGLYESFVAESERYQEPLRDEWYHETNGAGEYGFSVVWRRVASTRCCRRIRKRHQFSVSASDLT